MRPEIWPSSLALAIKIANMSATKLNSKGDNESPCLKPFLVWKNFPISSFTFTPTLPFDTNDCIHEHHFYGNLFILSVYCKKLHLTLSWAFSTSNFKMTLLAMDLWSSSNVSCKTTTNVSCKTTTPSRICRPGMKADCVGQITLSTTWVSLFTATFVNILKIILRRKWVYIVVFVRFFSKGVL